MIEIYPGTSGRTHGDKNEISPAMNEVKMEIWFTEFLAPLTQQAINRAIYSLDG